MPKERNMKKFVAIYLGSPSGRAKWEELDEQTRQAREKAGMNAWHKWGIDNEKSIVDSGAPLGKTKRIDSAGIADTKNAMAAYTIVQAESHEAAAKLFRNHPHFTIFPGDSIEIMECLPIPEM
jgi:hypothetical protein